MAQAKSYSDSPAVQERASSFDGEELALSQRPDYRSEARVYRARRAGPQDRCAGMNVKCSKLIRPDPHRRLVVAGVRERPAERAA
jgi:hypothetical protein